MRNAVENDVELSAADAYRALWETAADHPRVEVFLSQRAKAHDSATQADVSSLGKEVATYFVGGAGPLVLDQSTRGAVALTADTTSATTARLTIGSRPPATGVSANLSDPMAWCVALTDPDGATRDFRYSSRDDLSPGVCT